MGLRFEEPTVARVRQVIRDPKYAGAYIYGVHHWRRVQRGAAPVPENRLIGQFVENWDHHEGYISRQEYLDNIGTLALNAKTSKQSQLGPGPSLLQGRCRCAVHGAMVVAYHRRLRYSSWSLRCQGDALRGGQVCINVPGIALEEHVTTVLLQSLDVPVIEEAQRLWRTSHREWGKLHRGLEGEINQKVERRDRIHHRLGEPLDDMRLRAMYEAEYLKLDAEVEALKRRVAREETEEDPFTEARWEELKRLCADVSTIWSASTTTPQDRKQLVRLLIAYVEVESAEKERIVATVHWNDERPPTNVEILRVAHFHGLMWQWHLEGVPVHAIVDRLAAMGAKTQQMRTWSRPTVEKTLALMVKAARSSKDPDRRDVPPVRRDPHLAIAELDRAGLDASTIAEHLNTSGLPTRFGNAWSASSVARVIAGKRRKGR